jgi:hypothetical protein
MVERGREGSPTGSFLRNRSTLLFRWVRSGGSDGASFSQTGVMWACRMERIGLRGVLEARLALDHRLQLRASCEQILHAIHDHRRRPDVAAFIRRRGLGWLGFGLVPGLLRGLSR